MMVVINGLSNSGKDSFCEFCGDYIYTKTFSTVDIVRKASSLFGLSDTKNNLEHRNFMGELKQLVNRYNDHSFEYIKEQYESFKEHTNYLLDDDEFFIFVHSREAEEIERFKSEFNAITVLITSPNIVENPNNIPDKTVMSYSYDYIINNNGELEDLQYKALKFTKEVLNECNQNSY